MKKTLRKAMLSTICMLIVAVMSLTGVTYAWFTMAENATVEGIEMNVIAADGGIQLSVDGGQKWANALDLSSYAKNDVVPCSSADGVNFFSAVVNPANDKQITPAAITNKGNYVIEVADLMVRNSGYSDIEVDFKGTGFVDTDLNDTRDSSKAAKLAVFQQKTKPATDAEGKPTTETYWELLFIFGDGGYNGLIKAAPADDSKTTNVDESKVFLDVAGTDRNYFEAVTVENNPAATDTKMKFTVEGITVTSGENGTTTTHNDVHLKLVVWLEGQDADCVNQNAASGFSLNVVMNANEKQSS